MSFVCHQSMNDFFPLVEKFLYQHEAQYSLLIGLCEAIVAGELEINSNDTLFLRNSSSNAIGLQTSARTPLSFTEMRQSEINLLAQTALSKTQNIPSCGGPKATVENFLNLACIRELFRVKQCVQQAVHKLVEVNPSLRSSSGKCELATSKDLSTVQKFCFLFNQETPPFHGGQLEDYLELAKTKIDGSGVYLWLDNGQVVSMAHLTRPTLNGICLNYVYTPKEFRGHGYASSLAAEISHIALTSGKKFCTLYTDLSNPTSNKIYHRIGYQPILEWQYNTLEKKHSKK